MTSKIVFEQIGIIGLGLIGSSIARAVRKYHLAESIIGCDMNEAALGYARSHNFIDTAVRDAALVAERSQMVILAAPPSSLAKIAKQIAPKLREGAIVMDTASVKAPVMDMIAASLPINTHFIPAHPIAGSEQSGSSSGSEDLFLKRRVIVTPNEPLTSDVMQIITSFWSGMGARVEAMPPALHDKIYAYMSHLPHLLAFAARKIVLTPSADTNNIALQKFLRLSASRAALWNEIFFLNRDYLLPALAHYLAALQRIEQELLSAPEATKSSFDDTLARTALLPRIAASCLVTAVVMAEKEEVLSFARYAGRGFTDFTFVANTPPEQDLEKISNNHALVASVLKEYSDRLKSWQKMLKGNKSGELHQVLSEIAA